MPLEPLGIELGDWIAIGALIATPLIFWFGYVRTRKSEQFKIALDIMEKMHAGFRLHRRFYRRNKYTNRALLQSLEYGN
jgi:hypothetical protein